MPASVATMVLEADLMFAGRVEPGPAQDALQQNLAVSRDDQRAQVGRRLRRAMRRVEAVLSQGRHRQGEQEGGAAADAGCHAAH